MSPDQNPKSETPEEPVFTPAEMQARYERLKAERELPPLGSFLEMLKEVAADVQNSEKLK